MSQSNPGNTPPPASSPQASSQALLDELRVAADRARDERLKLARLVKHSADLPISGSAPGGDQPGVTGERINDLTHQVERLELAVGEKLKALGQVEKDIESRTQYLESLRHSITETTAAFTNQVEQAQHFKAHIDAAKQHVRMSAGRVVEEVRQQLTDLEGPIAERVTGLTELDEQIDKRIVRMQQMHKQANEAVDKHLLGALRSAKEQAAEISAPMMKELEKYIGSKRGEIEAAIQAKIAELDIDVEEALRPVTDRFNMIILDANEQADQLAGLMPERMEKIANEQLGGVSEKLTRRAQEIAAGIDKTAMEQAEQAMREKIATTLDDYLGRAEQDAGGYVDGLVARLDGARADALARYEQQLAAIDAQRGEDRAETLAEIEQVLDAIRVEAEQTGAVCRDEAAKALIELDQSLEGLREEVVEIKAKSRLDSEAVQSQLDAEVQRIQQLAEQRVAHAKSVLEESADSIHARASAAVDAALANAEEKLEAFESDAVGHLRAIDDGIEHGIEQSRKKIAEQEAEARKLADNAILISEQGIAEAQQRVANFESGITQRIGLAKKTVDDAVGSVDDRLQRVEQDASGRIMQIVELAETSGQAVADSMAELAASADQTARRAQEDLDAKLRAFEQISAEALHNAEQTLRENIGELRDASRSMIEVVARQVKAQAKDIEPQTREVISQAEQTMRRRLGELRDAAQSMVDLSVTRLESQLSEVKAKAQQAAFQPGPTPPAADGPGVEPPTSEAA